MSGNLIGKCPVCGGTLMFNTTMCIETVVSKNEETNTIDVESGPDYSDVMINDIYCIDGCKLTDDFKTKLIKQFEEKVSEEDYLVLCHDLILDL